MTPLVFMACAFGMSIGAGLLGALLGLGGGIIVVPAIALVLGVDIRYAIGASIVSVIATSSAAGAAYVKDHVANIRLAMFLELGTSAGALAGAFLAGIVDRRWLYFVFAGALTYAAVAMWRQKRSGGSRTVSKPDRLAAVLALDSSYVDQQRGTRIEYRVSRTPVGFAIGSTAGIASGLLGIGGGVIKVPAMALGMGVPMKVATATSNFMIGVTAAASAGVYFARGDVDPYIAAPTALGVLTGSFLGARYMHRVRSSWLRAAFTVILLIVASQMALKGFRL